MPRLSSCTACDGFLPTAASVCPHCDNPLVTAAEQPRRRSRFARLSRTLFSVAGGGALAVTLMACYGMSPRYRTQPPQGQQCTPAMDEDSDGVCPPEDCDNKRADVYPGAADTVGDGVDQNCDGADGIQGARPTPTPTTPTTDDTSATKSRATSPDPAPPARATPP